MSEHEKRRQETMRELAEKFRNSTGALRMVAHRINKVAEARNSDRKPVRNGVMPFSCLELIEFSSAAEFERFRDMQPITAEEITSVDWDELLRGLLGV